MKAWIWGVLILLTGCAQQLVYLPDLEQKKVDYYTACLEYEKTVQDANIGEVEKSCQRLQELCSIFYNRAPRLEKHDLHLLGLNLYRLNESIATWKKNQKDCDEVFRLVLTKKDMVVEPLRVRFNLEMEGMEDFLIQVRMVQARILLLNRLREECALKTERQEERFENFDQQFKAMEDRLVAMLFQAIPEKLTYVGQTVSRKKDFKFSPDFGTPAVNLSEEKLIASGDKNISDYYFYFEDEQAAFEVHMAALRESTVRFAEAAGAVQEEDASRQLKKIASMMEVRLNLIDDLYKKSLQELRTYAGNAEYIDTEFFNQQKQDDKNKYFAYYESAIFKLSNVTQEVLKLDKDGSQAASLQNNFLQLGKFFNTDGGSISTGYFFLADEWQKKISFDEFSATEMTKILQQIEAVTKEVIRPLWTTCVSQNRYGANNINAPYELDSNGYLQPKLKN